MIDIHMYCNVLDRRIVMKFKLPLLAVNDIDKSKKFYIELFEQTVTLNLGKNITFSGGFAIQQDFARLTEVEPQSVAKKSHNMELYFEVDDFDEFLIRLEKYGNIEFVHLPKQYEWKQRVVRIYDPDFHMIEVGESMEIIARRYLSQGKSAEAVAEIIQHRVEFVQKFIGREVLLENLDRLHSTPRGIERIKKNLGHTEEDVISWSKMKISSPNCNIERKGKNWYAKVEEYIFTINAHSYTIITAHKSK